MAKSNASIKYRAEEKRRHAIFIAIVLFILGLAMIIVSSYAYYRTTISGTISGTTGAWVFKANNATSSFNITLAPTQTDRTYNSTIAPGTSGSFDILIDGTGIGSPMSADYTITFSNFVNKPANLKFYSDSNFSTETDITANGYSITGTVASGNSTTKTIYWKWEYGTSSSITSDNSAADKNVSFTVTVVGTQHQI